MLYVLTLGIILYRQAPEVTVKPAPPPRIRKPVPPRTATGETVPFNGMLHTPKALTAILILLSAHMAQINLPFPLPP